MLEDSDQLVRVAAAVIKRESTALICQRGINHRYGLKWEFPGGKTYPGEPLNECLERELLEELDIEPKKYTEIKTIQVTYPDGGRFLITFFLIESYDGEIRNKVFEQIEWVPIDKLGTYDLLEGSIPILKDL